MPVSKSFAIATEGPTIDGRNISREWILQMAKSYDPKVYTAVVNLEHYLSPLPDSLFSAYGKVVSLGTQEAEILGEKKLQLTAVVDVSDEATTLQKAGKKAFASMEIQPNFIGKGITYLTGLALTDKPASVGTEAMKFSAFSKGDKENVLAFASEIGLEFEAAEATKTPGDTLFAKVKEILGLGKKDTDGRFADVGQAVEAIAASQRDQLNAFANFGKELAALDASVKRNAEAIEASKAEFAALQAQLDKTPDGTPKRPAATGGDSAKTDC